MAMDGMLAYIGRRICRLRGGRRLISPLRRYYSRIYDGRPDRWTVIRDYQGRLSFKVDRAAYMGSAIYWQGWHHLYEQEYIARELRGDHVFIDAGANTGEFTISVAGRLSTGCVLAFEPQADVHQVLAENVAMNALTRVRLFKEGLSEGEATVTLYTSNDRLQFDGIHEGLYTQFPDETRAVPAGTMHLRSLDAILKEQNISRIDWIKIDVEGGELPLLRGASEAIQRSKPRLIVEYNEPTFRNAGYTGADMDNFLREFGYRSYLFTRTGLVQVSATSIGSRARNLLYVCDDGIQL